MKTLTHPAAQEWILSGRALDPEESAGLSEHLACCPQCREFAAFQQELLVAVPQIAPAVTLSEREVRQRTASVQARLKQRTVTTRFFHGTRALALLFSALALVALLAFVIVRLIPEQTRLTLGGLAKTPTAVQVSPPASSATPLATPSGPEKTPITVLATRPPASATPLSTFSAKLTPTVQVTDEQVLAKALLNTDQNVYCSWMILGYGTQEIYAWVLCQLQVEPQSAASVPVVIHLDSAGHYEQVDIPRDGNLYAPDVLRLFPPNVQSDILGQNLTLQDLEWGIAQRKTGVFKVPYVTLAFPIMDIPGCTWKSEPLSNLAVSTAPGLSGWKSVIQAGTGFSLSIPPDWSASQAGRDCGAGLAAPYFLALQPPDTHYQLTIGFRRPDQPAYITRTGTPAGDFIDAGQVSFFGNGIPVQRLVYQGRDMAVFYNGSGEFAAEGNLFTLSLDIISDPKNNQSIPPDVEDQARQILASFQAYPPTLPNLTATPVATLPVAQPLTLLSQRGGSVKGVALSGNTAYVGIGPRLAALDVSDPAAPRLLAQSQALPGAVSGVLLFSAAPNLSAAVVGAGRYIEVLDISQPDKIIQVNEVALPGTINTMILDRVNWKLYAGSKTYAYYDPNAGPVHSGYVAVVDLKDPGGLPLLGQVVPLTHKGCFAKSQPQFIGSHLTYH